MRHLVIALSLIGVFSTTSSYSQNATNVVDANQVPVDEKGGLYRLFQGGIGGAEIYAVVRMFKFRNNSSELVAARNELKANTERLNKYRESFRTLSRSTEKGLRARLKVLNDQLNDLRVHLAHADQAPAYAEDVNVIQGEIIERNESLMKIENQSLQTKEAQSLVRQIHDLQDKLRVRIQSELHTDPFVFKVQVDEIQREIAEITEALRSGKVAGTSLAAYESEAAAVAHQIVSAERMIAADTARINSIIQKIKSQGIFRHFRYGVMATVLGDALLIFDAAPRIGYLLTFAEDPGVFGIDNSIVTVKEVIIGPSNKVVIGK